MNSARLDTLRRLLGLSIDETAQVCDDVNQKTVNRWMRGELPTPDWPIDRLEALRSHMEDQVSFALSHWSGEPLIRYRTREVFEASPDKAELPFGAHAMMIGWLTEAIEADGRKVELIWVERSELNAGEVST